MGSYTNREPASWSNGFAIGIIVGAFAVMLVLTWLGVLRG